MKQPIPRPFARALGGLGLAWLHSLRPSFIDQTELPASGILALWHEHFLLCLPAFTHLKLRALASQSRDGDWATRACRGFGYAVARGSSSRGGSEALLQLARELSSAGGWAALTVDGPRGPRHVSKPGALWLSRRTGLPITAVSASVSPALRSRSWDGSTLPLPFARIRLRVAPPCFPEQPSDLDRVLESNAAQLKVFS